MVNQTLYTADVTTRGGRSGHVESSDGNMKLHLSPPEGMGGQGGSGTNPEQLFGAAYAACFGGAVQYAASQKKIDTGDVMVQAQVGIGPSSDKEGFEISVALEVTLSKLNQKDAEALVAEAHRICPYSNATRGNVDVKLTTHGGR
ncbi:MAG: organic hydroperoxide resistance protein [Acidobacteriaceae bacterium]